MGFMNLERRPRLDLPAIRAANPLPGVVAGAGVKLQRAGTEWKGCCPIHAERTPSFTIFAGGERFHCFGCGATGDVLDFVQALHGVGLVDAAELLGAGDLPQAPAPVVAINSGPEPDRTPEALAIWEASAPAAGTLAETYLQWRGITIEPPLSVRFTVLPFGRTREPTPCLVACVSGVDGPLIGIQRTFLAPDGKGKASAKGAKLSLGKIAGGAIRLGPLDGPDLIVTEGLEDGLTLLQATGCPVWVAAGATNLSQMRFPPSVQRVSIGGDNDLAGRANAEKAAEAFVMQGLAVRVFYPVEGAKDFNAQLMEASA